MVELILASQSAVRATLLEKAGLHFKKQSATIDERAIETPLVRSGFDPGDIADVLAEAKAIDVSAFHRDAYVIGADQTMSYEEGGILVRGHKAQNMEEARHQLLALRGKTHRLHTSVCCVCNGETVFRHSDCADLTMRDFSPSFVGHYLAIVGAKALTSVGCYQLEGLGIQLFEKIDGNYFTILGLPLLPLLDFLRLKGVVEE